MGRVVDFGLVRVHRLPDVEGQVLAFRVFGAHGIVLGSLEARREARCEVLRDFGRCRIADAGLAAGDVVTMVSKAGYRGESGRWSGRRARPAMKRQEYCEFTMLLLIRRSYCVMVLISQAAVMQVSTELADGSAIGQFRQRH